MKGNDTMKLCKVPYCNIEHYAKGFCEKHYHQYRKYGESLSPRNNDIILYDNYAEVIIKNKKGEEKARVLIGLDDVEKISGYRWNINKNGYAFNKTVGLMHRFITDCPEGMVVDHINHNTLDNRKCNLRICAQADNIKNQKKSIGNYSSIYKGVCLDKTINKWRAYISINNKRKYLGIFDSELEASIKYDKASIMYHGIYCKTNHPMENYIDYIVELGLEPSDFGIEEDKGANI